MRFFEALNFVDKQTKGGWKVYCVDLSRNKKLIWSGPTWEEAKQVAQDAKFRGDCFDTEILDPMGNPVQRAGRLLP